MSNELLDSVRSAFPETLIAKFSTLLGESEVNTIKAIHGSIPMVLTDILHKAYFPEGIGKVNTLARQAVTSDFFGQLHEFNVGNGVLVAGSSLLNKGTDFSKALLAGRTDAVVNEISRYSNTGISSAAFIVGLVSLGALDAVGRYLTHSSVDGNSLAGWIKAQGGSIVHAIPVGLEVKAALGIQHYPWEKRTQKSRNSVLYAVIVVIIVAVAALLIYRSYQQKEAASTTAADTTATAAAPTVNTDTTTAPRNQINLPDGHVIDATRGGTEDRLIAFLNDPNAPLDKKNGNWFDFTKVRFASNGASLLPESDAQLRNIASILDAFPKARIKVGGNTEGEAGTNVHLAKKRADHILAKLKDLSVKHSQLEGAEGSDRAMNHGMSIDVKAK
jgi:outer membrane protein OmpA-like peptidoglycan-associated protein